MKLLVFLDCAFWALLILRADWLDAHRPLADEFHRTHQARLLAIGGTIQRRL